MQKLVKHMQVPRKKITPLLISKHVCKFADTEKSLKGRPEGMCIWGSSREMRPMPAEVLTGYRNVIKPFLRNFKQAEHDGICL